MSIRNFKYIVWVIFLFICFFIFNSWQHESVDKVVGDKKQDVLNVTDFDNRSSLVSDNLIFIDTNLIHAKIDLVGGDLVYLEFKKYKISSGNDEGVVFFDNSDSRYYLPQSGFLNNIGPDSVLTGRSLYTTDSTNYVLSDGSSVLKIKLDYINDKLKISKIYTFKSYSYDIELKYVISNNSENIYSGKIYGLFKSKKLGSSNSSFMGIRTYSGGAVYTKDKPCKKLSFDDIENKKFYELVNGGWVGMIDHYFLSSWIPNIDNTYIYSSEKIDDLYIVKYMDKNDIVVLPSETKDIILKLYTGPKVKTYLNELSKGLELTIDYGIFWPIANPIFYLLSLINNYINNWGISIILVTLIIKLLFFNLSSISYRSMGKMKKLQPRLDILKENYKDDKKKFGQSVMELYKKEKVNPLSGCLPILIQIPVFISLYYVLLESVELRHAGFIFWIDDLSSKDRYYILPILMGVSMYFQQKLNPPMQDPIQAKVMLFMPLFFVVLFLQFPSGLVLYWVVNNILSIIQQWFIMKTVGKI